MLGALARDPEKYNHDMIMGERSNGSGLGAMAPERSLVVSRSMMHTFMRLGVQALPPLRIALHATTKLLLLTSFVPILVA